MREFIPGSFPRAAVFSRPRRACAGTGAHAVERLEDRRLLAADPAVQINVNFQTETTPDAPPGYIADIGRAFGRRANGRFYGWSDSNEAQMRQRDLLSDPRYDTLARFDGRSWEIDVPNGDYAVRIVAGDEAATDSVYRINAEGILALDGTPSSGNRFFDTTTTVTVTDGRLTLSSAGGSSNNKIAFVEIRSAAPTVAISAPDSSAGEADLNHGTFRITCSGDLSRPLGVHFAVGGTATNGVDYGVAGDGVTIPAGAAFVDMTLRVIPDDLPEPTETVTISLVDAGAYVIDPPAAMATVTIADANGGASPAEIFSVRVNFQPYDVSVPGGYVVDGGAVYGRRANGLIYGWNRDNTAAPVDRDSDNAPDQRYDTFLPMGADDQWAMAVPNGTYEVFLAVGDPARSSGYYSVDVEGVRAIDHEPTSSQRFAGETRFVVVSDGALTLGSGLDAENNKLLFVEITRLLPGAPSDPRALTATAASPTSVRLQWSDRSSNEVGFRIERRTDGDETWARIATVDAGQESYLDAGVAPNTRYTYRVRAVNADGASGYTTDAVTTPAESNPLPTRIEWTRVADSPVDRAESNGAVVNGKLYVFGGLYTSADDRVLATPRSDVYDPATNTWTRIADQPVAMTHSPSIVVGNVIWFIGGYVGDHPGPGTRQVWKYDVSSDTWSRGPDLPSSRGAGSGGLIGNKIYYFGGMNRLRTEERGNLYILDLGNLSAGWSEGATMPNPRNHIGGAAVGGYLYALGGQYGQEEAQDAQNDIHRYDPATDTWEHVADFPTGRSHITAGTFVYQGRIVIVGGETGEAAFVRFVTIFDPADNSFTELTQLPRSRSTVVAGVLPGGRIIWATGNGPSATDEAWIGTLK